MLLPTPATPILQNQINCRSVPEIALPRLRRSLAIHMLPGFNNRLVRERAALVFLHRLDLLVGFGVLVREVDAAADAEREDRGFPVDGDADAVGFGYRGGGSGRGVHADGAFEGHVHCGVEVVLVVVAVDNLGLDASK